MLLQSYFFSPLVCDAKKTIWLVIWLVIKSNLAKVFYNFYHYAGTIYFLFGP